MLILHVAAPSDVGGLERVVQGLAREQRRAGHDVHVAAILTGPAVDHPFLTPLADAGVETHIVLPGPRGYRRERGAVAELCRRLRPTVVHTHGYRPDVLDAGVARRAGVPVVTTVHGFTGGGRENRAYEWLDGGAVPRLEAGGGGAGTGPRAGGAGALARRRAGRRPVVWGFRSLGAQLRYRRSPMVVFEAMAAGVPVIATDVGGVPEMLTPEEAAFVPPEHPAALAAAIRAAYRAPAAARARAARARERLCRDFGTERWCERYDGIYQLVSSRSPVPVLP